VNGPLVTALFVVFASGAGFAWAIYQELRHRRRMRDIGSARVRHCPDCGMTAIVTDRGWLVHRDLCRQRIDAA